MADTSYVVARDNARMSWTVTSVVEFHGKVFKNYVGEANTKQEAIAIATKAKAAERTP